MRKVSLLSIVMLLMPASLFGTEPSAPVNSDAFYAGSPAEASIPPESHPRGSGAFYAGEYVEVAHFDAVPTIPEVDPFEAAFKNYDVPPTQDGDVVCLDCGETVNLDTEAFCTMCEQVASAQPSTTTTTTVTTTTMTSQEGGEMSSDGSVASFGSYGGPIRNFFGNAKARRDNRRARRQSRGGLFRSCSSSTYQAPMAVSSPMTMSC